MGYTHGMRCGTTAADLGIEISFEEVLRAVEPVFEPPAQPEADSREKTFHEIIEALSWVGARGNEGPLKPGGWRITESGRIQIHCRCGTEFLASEETGLGNGGVGYCIGCKKKIHASSYWERWTAGKANQPFQWIPGVSRDGVRY